jgi:hypothetical protein
MTEEKKQTKWFWPQLTSEKDAFEGIKVAAGMGLFISFGLVIVTYFTSKDWSVLWDVTLYLSCSAFLYKKHSRVAAVLILTNYIVGIGMSISEGNFKAAHSFIVLVFTSGFITGVRSSFFLRRLNKEGSGPITPASEGVADAEKSVIQPDEGLTKDKVESEAAIAGLSNKKIEIKTEPSSISTPAAPEAKKSTHAQTVSTKNQNTVPTSIKVVGGIVALGTVFSFGTIFVMSKKSSMQAQEESIEKDTVKYKLLYMPKSCPPKFPMLFFVKNNHVSKTIKKMEFYAEVYEPGRSQNLNRYSLIPRTFDAIVPPGKSAHLCYALPEFTQAVEDASILIYRASLRYDGPEFYAPGEFIPSEE